MTDKNQISLYVHIPFCETKCPYCDFNTYARIESLMPSYVPALRSEISMWGQLLDSPEVHTVFFGGGTPSYLPAGEIGSVIDTIRSAFRVDTDAEITLEANPDDFTQAKLASYLEFGVNRLSIGFQSLDDRLLKLLGRRHSAEEAIEAYKMALDAGFRNASVDLMYGLPHQGIEDWQQTIEGVVNLNPPHVSMYSLILEGGTPMEQWVKLGKLPEPDPDLAADMYLMAQDVMRDQGYRHYEISNWAMHGFESLHNLTYWRNEPYLGVGPGAHSYLYGHRFSNLRPPREYIRLLSEQIDFVGATGESPTYEAIKSVPVVENVEAIDKPLEMAETMMLGLRLDTGISLSEFAYRFGSPPSAFYSDTIEDLKSLGLLETANGSLHLTHKGRMLGNEVFSRFFA